MDVADKYVLGILNKTTVRMETIENLFLSNHKKKINELNYIDSYIIFTKYLRLYIHALIYEIKISSIFPHN